MEAEMKRRSPPKRNEAMTAPRRDPIEVRSLINETKDKEQRKCMNLNSYK